MPFSRLASGVRFSVLSIPVAVLLFLLGVSLPLAVAQTAAGAGSARHRYDNSLARVPAKAAHTIRPLSAEKMGESLEIEIPLKMRNMAKLREHLANGEIIPPAIMQRDYLPLASDYTKVVNWLKGEGFTITHEDSSNLSVFARGTVPQIQKSFQVQMGQITVDGTDFHNALTSPSLPAEISAPVLGINGLQPFLKAHHRQAAGPNPAISNAPPYLVKEILNAYGATNLGVTGAGQKIAILIDTVPSSSDLTAFWAANNIPQSLSNVEDVNVKGTAYPPRAIEETLDVEWSSGIAPAAKVRVYAAGSLYFNDLNKALQRIISDLPSQPQLHQMSISLGLGETEISQSIVDTESQYLATIAANGVTIFASSGDDGSEPDQILQVEFYASDPSVTGVGGTTLHLNSASGAVSSETGWADSGGGVSALFSRPGWQTGTGVPAGSMRLVPDVSLAADPNTGAYIFYEGKEQQIGGTSWGSPTWAGFCALINQARATAGKPPLGILGAQNIYSMIGTNNFRDLTSGNNTDYSAHTGYDLVTGIGVPNVSVLLKTLTGQNTTAPSIVSFDPTTGTPGTPVTITGLNLGRATSVTFNGVSAAINQAASSDTKLAVTVPQGALTGPISVVTPNGSAASSGTFTVTAVATNDNFANGTTISGTAGTATGSNVGATKEAGEPDHAGNPGGHSVWFTWTAPITGTYNFDTSGSSFDTLLAVYVGSSVNALTQVAANDDAGSAVTSSVAFTGTAGVVYHIAVDGYEAAGSTGAVGTVVLNWNLDASAPSINAFTPVSGAAGTVVTISGANFTGATSVVFNKTSATSFTVDSPTQITATVPDGATTGSIAITTPDGTAASSAYFTVPTVVPNDDFASAQAVAGLSGSATGTNVGASIEPGEPDHAGKQGGHSIWYSWTAPASGFITFNTFGSTFDTLLAVYTGSNVDALTAVASNDDGGPGSTSSVSFSAAAGITYSIAIDGFGGATGSTVLNWQPISSVPQIAYFTPASGAPGTPVLISGSGFTGVSSVTFSGVQSTFEIQSDTELTTTVPAGATTGPIQVSNLVGASTTSDSFTISAVASNDDFANRAVFPRSGGTVAGSNVGATKQPGEPNHAGNKGGASVWWTWTAPKSGLYEITTLGSNFDTLLGIYTGTKLTALTRVASNDDDPAGGHTSSVNLGVIAGKTYQIAVDGFDGSTGNVTLTIIPATRNTGYLYSTTFDYTEGYSSAVPLAGQRGWRRDGSGGNGIVNGVFPGEGQQGYVGRTPPPWLSHGIFLYRPINYTPLAGEIVTFSVDLTIHDSTNNRYDVFQWALFNRNTDFLFALNFDNDNLGVSYLLDDGNEFDTGLSFENGATYHLVVTMDFSSNLWSATINGETAVTDQPITTTANTAQPSSLDIGDMDAAWLNRDGHPAGNNSMIFDNYSLMKTSGPSIIVQPISQIVDAGSSVNFVVSAWGNPVPSFQWQKNGADIKNATSSSLTLTNVQMADAGSYTVVVSNTLGTVASQPASLMVNTPGSSVNLDLLQPQGWQAKIAISPTAGLPNPNGMALLTSSTIYANFVVQNTGLASTGVPFSSALYVDGVLAGTFTSGTAIAAGGESSVLDYSLGLLAAGMHTVEVIIDSDNQVSESTKTDNVVTQTFVVYPPQPAYSIRAALNNPVAGSVSGTGTYWRFSLPTLTATANYGYVFKGWSENGIVVSRNPTLTFRVRRPHFFVANFKKQNFPFSVAASPAGSGTFRLGPALNAAKSYPYNTTVTVTAVPRAGYSFVSWSGDASGSSSTVQVLVNSAKAITANFVKTSP